MRSPLLLQAQISPPVGGGSFGLADTTRLENPYQEAMWLDEIRFSLVDGLTEGTGLYITSAAWASLKVQLSLGNLPLTNGFVPISLLGKVLNGFAEVAQTIVENNPCNFTWKLPKPLYIPAREFLRPVLYRDPAASSEVLTTVNITYCCRPVERGEKPPKVLQVPWVTYFKPAYQTFPGAVGLDQTDQSTPSDLYNPWDQELHVQRFVGRLMGLGGGVNWDTEEPDNMALASAEVNLTTGAITCGTLVSAQDSFNNILIRDRTPFAHVFDFIDRAWTVNCTLPPKGFYLFVVDRLWAGYTGGVADQSFTVGIAMIGWREVKYLGSP